MTTETSTWNQRISALDQFVEREGHALVPAKHLEAVGDKEIALGSWVSYVRTQYRNGRLWPNRTAELETYPDWQWGPLRPGPKPDASRDAEIRRLREENKSLQEIGDMFGLSRQRVHQIVTPT